MKKLKVVELFGGIGAPRAALEIVGIDFEVVDYVEIDKYAVKSYNAMYNESYEPQDITTWNKDIECDLIFHGSPCQDFSLAGNRKGGDENSGTRSSLMYETIRIVTNLKPKYVIWENVKGLLNKKNIHNFNKYLDIMEELGYTNSYKVLNAKDFGIPQNRERIFTVSILGNVLFEFPEGIPLDLCLKDILEKKTIAKPYISDKLVNTFTRNNTNHKYNRLERFKPIYIDMKYVNTIMTKGGSWCVDNYIIEIHSHYNFLKLLKDYNSIPSKRNKIFNISKNDLTNIKYKNIKKSLENIKINQKDHITLRNLTPLEKWRLMGFTDFLYNKAQSVNSHTQLEKQAGNSIYVGCLVAIFEIIKEYECLHI